MLFFGVLSASAADRFVLAIWLKFKCACLTPQTSLVRTALPALFGFVARIFLLFSRQFKFAFRAFVPAARLPARTIKFSFRPFKPFSALVLFAPFLVLQ